VADGQATERGPPPRRRRPPPLADRPLTDWPTGRPPTGVKRCYGRAVTDKRQITVKSWHLCLRRSLSCWIWAP